MLPIIQILGLPFLICILMSTILGYLGIHVLKREVIFIDIALAQIAAVGSIAAHFAFEAHEDSVVSYMCSGGFVMVVGVLYAVARRRIIQISLEAVIGISYGIAAGAALFMVGVAPGGHLHVQQILAGSLLWAGVSDVIVSLIVFSVVIFCFIVFQKPFARISNNYDGAVAEGVKVIWWDCLFYALLGVVVTMAVKVAGIVVVFAYLIIPATTSAIFSQRLWVRLVINWAVAAIASVGGLLFAYYLDFSIGPAIALLMGCELAIAAVVVRGRQLALVID